MDTPNFGAILWDAVKTDAAMIWSGWPTWSNEHPLIWAIPGMMIFGIARALWPKKRRTR